MDKATLLGLAAGISIILAAIVSVSDISTFLNLPGLMVVLGGTTAALFIKFPLSQVLPGFVGGLKEVMSHRSNSTRELISQIVDLSMLARKRGKLSLEKAHINNAYLQKGAQLIADGHSAAFIRKVMKLDLENNIERFQFGERVFRAIGDSAPAFGMIGTLVGLVQMLSHLDDTAGIGQGMAVALLTTLYGSLIANLFANPIADKLQLRAQEDYYSSQLIIEGLLAIHEGMSPKVIEQLLESCLLQTNTAKPESALPVSPDIRSPAL